MSDKNQETIADIVREMRGPYYKMGRSNASLDKDMMGYMSFMANRIEAAAKREREATRENSSHVGNAAKMREALRMYQEVFEKIRNSAWFIDANFHEIMSINKVMTAADAALAKAGGAS